MNDDTPSKTRRIGTVLIAGLILFAGVGLVSAAQSADAITVGYRYCEDPNGADIIVRHDTPLTEDMDDCEEDEDA